MCGLTLDHTLTLLGHPHSKALLQPAVLTAVPGDLVDDAIPVSVARVHHVLLHAAAEEALHRKQETPVSSVKNGSLVLSNIHRGCF